MAAHKKSVFALFERAMKNGPQNALSPPHSKCCLQPSSSNIPWKLVGNAYSQAPPAYWIKNCGGLMLCFRRKRELKESLVINEENLKELQWRMRPKTYTWEINLFFGENLNFHETGQFTLQDHKIFIKLF